MQTNNIKSWILACREGRGAQKKSPQRTNLLLCNNPPESIPPCFTPLETNMHRHTPKHRLRESDKKSVSVSQAHPCCSLKELDIVFAHVRVFVCVHPSGVWMGSEGVWHPVLNPVWWDSDINPAFIPCWETTLLFSDVSVRLPPRLFLTGSVSLVPGNFHPVSSEQSLLKNIVSVTISPSSSVSLSDQRRRT